ncbi:MAG: hypothetical protein IPI49_19145 [Myxococcales bacterium]|nr:hypothetical protein [Myxococcales bacterium]HRC58264.1 hypothetical protein [Kofleriaceae bacterium]
MAVVAFENARSVNAYYTWDPRVLLGVNAVANQNYRHKADTIGDLLIASNRISNYIDNGPWGGGAPQEVRVRLHTVKETIPNPHVNHFCFGTISQISYATAAHAVTWGIPAALQVIPGVPAANAAIATVHIEMDSWYFENYPLGFCAGMLCHEFAVHCMGDFLMTGRQRAAENFHQGPLVGSWAPNANPLTAGQIDHVFASCDLQPRYRQYRATVIEVAQAMAAAVGGVVAPGRVAVVANDVTDLFRCYLMDVASIQATNDHRAKGLTRPAVVATCFNNHRAALIVALGAAGANALIARVPPVITAATVTGNFFYLASSLLWGFLPNYSKSWWGY